MGTRRRRKPKAQPKWLRLDEAERKLRGAQILTFGPFVHGFERQLWLHVMPLDREERAYLDALRTYETVGGTRQLLTEEVNEYIGRFGSYESTEDQIVDEELYSW